MVSPRYLPLVALTVVNVGKQHVPAADTILRVSHGKRARLEPTVHAIGSTLTKLILVRLPGFPRAPPQVDHARKVVRMDGIAGRPILQFLTRLAEILQDLAIQKLHLAGGTQGTHHARNGIDDQA